MPSDTSRPHPHEAKVEIVPVTPLQQNCSILCHPAAATCVVVDPGGDVPVILQRLHRLGVTVEAILLTHGHLDHAGGAEELRRALAAIPGAAAPPLIGPDRRDAFLLSGITAQARAYGLEGMFDAFPDRYLQEGDVLDIAGRRLEVLLVPGHTPGHVVFFDRTARLLVGGDALFAGSVGRTDFPYGDGELLIRSIKQKLLPLGDDVTVLPGHGPATRIGEERRGNPFLR